MPPATLHGVQVTTKLYFVIFAAFKESGWPWISLRGLQGHTFWQQSKARVWLYIGR